MYKKTNEELKEVFFNKKTGFYKSKYEYFFNEEKQQHIIIVNFANNEKRRFTKNVDSVQVKYEHYDSYRDKWFDSELSTSHYDDKNIIMWPLFSKNETLRFINFNYFRITQDIVDKNIKHFLLSHPEYDKNNNNNKESPKSKKINKAQMILNKKWKGIHRKSQRINEKFIYKKWWNNFVDSDLFKVLIYIKGTSKSNPIFWNDYVKLSSINNNNFKNHIENMDIEKILLNKIDIKHWGNFTTEDIVPKLWLDKWQNVKKLPFSVKKEIVKFIYNHAELNVINNNKININYYSGNVKYYEDPNFCNNSLEDPTNIFWKIFKDYQIHQRSMKPRQKLMGLVASLYITERGLILEDNDEYSFNYDPNAVPKAPFDHEFSPKELEDVAKYIYKFSKIWKQVNKKKYHHWGYMAQDTWKKDCFEVVRASLKKGYFNVPKMSVYISAESIKKYNAVYESELLHEEIKHIKTAKQKDLVKKVKRKM